MILPLEGLLVLDFSQFMAGPAATLRLADLGARVVKIERPETGDGSRRLFCSNQRFGNDSALFHTVNRRKQSVAIDLKSQAGLATAKKLIARADVLVENFRPGVMARLGLDFQSVSQLNPRLVYASVTGYGADGPWSGQPGQDLLAQARSGLVWLSGNASDPPVPFGLAIADMFAAQHLAQGILACLLRREKTGRGGLVEASLLESILDFQFEVFTTHLNDGGKLPVRGKSNSAHAYLAAPYGIYETADGYLAIAMTPVAQLGQLLGAPSLVPFEDRGSWFSHRDEIRAILADHLRSRPTRAWLDLLEPADVWCAQVLSWADLVQHDAFKTLNMIQQLSHANGGQLFTTRCPIRIDGQIIASPDPGPELGEQTEAIVTEFALATDIHHGDTETTEQ
jgi:crotonobetainyl-CoA:carnitine CoA-transferase CaiB-like acyl-CoA transferase